MQSSPRPREHRPWRILAGLLATFAATLALWAMLHIGPQVMLQDFDDIRAGYHAAEQAMHTPRDTPPLR